MGKFSGRMEQVKALFLIGQLGIIASLLGFSLWFFFIAVDGTPKQTIIPIAMAVGGMAWFGLFAVMAFIRSEL